MNGNVRLGRVPTAALLGFLLLPLPALNAGQLMSDCSADTIISENFPDQNFGGETSMGVSGEVGHRGDCLMKFNVSAIPADSTVTRVVLDMVCYSVSGNGQLLLCSIDSSWSEYGATWSHFPSAGAYKSYKSFSGTGTHRWDTSSDGGISALKNLVQAWVNGSKSNYGLQLVREVNDATWFAYRTRESGQGPLLYVEYSPPPTRVIRLDGDLAFGSVQVGTTVQRTLRIYNDGNSTLSVSGISCPSGFSGAWSGTIGAGSYRDVTVTFSPSDPTSYGGNVTVSSDATSGTNTKAISGTGVAQPTASISLVASPSNGGTVSGGGSYNVGQQVQISATANSGWQFGSWSDGGARTHTITVPSGGATYTASFTQTGGGSDTPDPEPETPTGGGTDTSPSDSSPSGDTPSPTDPSGNTSTPVTPPVQNSAVFTGTLQGNTITGTWLDGSGNQGTWSAQRK